MSYDVGRPFRAHTHETDASSGADVPIFEMGGTVAYTLKDNEYLEVHSVQVVSAAGGDVFLNCGASSADTAAEQIFRGTVAGNGGIVGEKFCPPFAGPLAGTLWVDAPAGVCDVTITGFIRSGRSDVVDGKQNYQANDRGQ